MRNQVTRKNDVRAFCRRVAAIKGFASRMKDESDRFTLVELYMNICKECEALCSEMYGAEGISILFGVERGQY